MKYIINNFILLVGLFVPVKFIGVSGGKWQTTISIGGIPLGWIIVAIAILF